MAHLATVRPNRTVAPNHQTANTNMLMKNIIIALLFLLPMMAAAQNRHLDDLRAGKLVQFEQENSKAYLLVSMQKSDDETCDNTYIAIVQFDPIPNKDEDMSCVCHIKGEEIELYLIEAPIKPIFYIRFDDDNVKLRIASDERWITMYRLRDVGRK